MVNNESQSALWQELASFEINEGGESFTFENRLAKDNGWSRDYAQRVVHEYRKFVFLCATAGHPCSPSEQVDEAWHLHMIYTRSYWNRLCPLLPAPLHHHPTKGGVAESAKFDDWYTRTLDSYRQAFGEQPPIDIWPPASERFVDHTIKIDPRQHLVISKRVLRQTAAVGVAAALVLLTTVGWVNMVGQIDLAAGVIMGIFGVVLVGGIASAAAMSTKLPAKRRREDGSSCGSGPAFLGSGCGTSSSGDSGGSDGGSSGGDAGGGGGDGGGGGGCGGGCGGGGCGS